MKRNPRAGKGPDNLYQDGEREFDTDKGYYRHDVRKTERARRGPDNLQPLDGFLDEDTESRKQYGYKQGERSRAVRRGSTLAPDGEREFDTDKGFRSHSVGRRPRAQKRGDNLRPQSGNIEDITEYEDSFFEKEKSKARSIRRGSYLAQAGDMEFESHHKSAFRHHEASKPDKRGHGGDNLSLPGGIIDGDTEHKKYQTHEKTTKERGRKKNDNLEVMRGDRIDSATENKEQFYSKDGQHKKPGQIRHADNLSQSGNFDWQTMKNSEYRKQAWQKRERPKAIDNLTHQHGQMEDRTEMKDNFDYKDTKPIKKVRGQYQHLQPEGGGGVQGESEAKAKFKAAPAYGRRSGGRRPEEMLKLQEGRLEGDTETKSKFKHVPTHGRRSGGGGGRKSDNLKPQEGRLEGNTETRSVLAE